MLLSFCVILLLNSKWSHKKRSESSMFNKPCLLCDLNRGNWWGHSPYKHGTPCSACPPSYGGGCKDNLCYKGTCWQNRKTEEEKLRTCLFIMFFVTLLEDDNSNLPHEETEENNFIEPEAPRTPQRSWPRVSRPEPPSFSNPAPTKPPTKDLQKNEVVNTEQMCKLPFNCLFWIQFHLKMGGIGSGFGDGRCTEW